jgi:uncharacterized protein (DUF433 family)
MIDQWEDEIDDERAAGARQRLDPWPQVRSPCDMSVPHVSVRPEDGQPCFEGTSTPIDVLFANLAAGERLDVILDHFPTIRREAAVAVLRESLRMVREGAMVDAGLSPDVRAIAGAGMHPADWAALEVDERREHYPRR